MATARFRVNRILRLRDYGVWICGVVVDGSIEVGMHIQWPSPDHERDTFYPIAGVDFLDLDQAKGIVEIALQIAGTGGDAALEQRLAASLVIGMTVEVADANQ